MTDIECIKRAQGGDNVARDKIFDENTGLIYMVIKRFSGRGYDSEELFQIGAIGLLKAIDRFNIGSGYEFSTYAVPMIIGEIRRFLRDDGMIHISRSIKENARKIANAVEKEMKLNNKNLTISELKTLTGLSHEEIILATEAYRQPKPIEEYMQQASGVEDKEAVINKLVIQQLLDGLEEQDKKLIILRYIYEKTQTQTANIMGINQVKVSRKEKDILKRMRIKLNML